MNTLSFAATNLAFDCSFAGLSLLLEHENNIFQQTILTPRASDDLHLHLVQLFARAETDSNQLSTLAVTTGPGSFTGIRIGLAVAQAFKLVHPSLQLVGLPTLPLLAYQYAQKHLPTTPFAVVLNAAGGQVYVQTFQVVPNATPQALTDAQVVGFNQLPPMPLYVQSGVLLPYAPADITFFDTLSPEALRHGLHSHALHVALQPVYLKPLNYRQSQPQVATSA